MSAKFELSKTGIVSDLVTKGAQLQAVTAVRRREKTTNQAGEKTATSFSSDNHEVCSVLYPFFSCSGYLAGSRARNGDINERLVASAWQSLFTEASNQRG